MSSFVLCGGWSGRLIAFAIFLLLNTGARSAGISTNNDLLPNLAVGKNTDGRLEVFQVDGRGELRHRWEAKSTREWSSWSSLGGNFHPSVTVIADAEGRLMVFAVDRASQQVEFNQQKDTNFTGWSKWQKLPGPAMQPEVTAGLDAGGRVELFAVATNGLSLKRVRQTDDRQGWGEWTDMGAMVAPAPVVARNATGQLEIFAIDFQSKGLMHCWQAAPGKLDQWSAWSNLDETMLPGFAVGPNADGRLEAAGVDAERGQLVHACQISARPDSEWSSWLNLGSGMKPAIAMGRNDDGRIEIFMINETNNMIFHTFQTKPGTITNWVFHRADMAAATASNLGVANNFQGLLEIFAVDQSQDEVLNHRRIISGNLYWTDWVSLDHSRRQYMSRIWRSEDGLSDNRVQAIAQTQDGYLWIGTPNGLAKFDGVRFNTPDGKGIADFANRYITSLMVDADGALWIGSDGAGAARLTGENITRFTAADGLAGDSITSLCRGKDGSMWLGTKTGLSRFKNGAFTNMTTKEGLLADSICSMAEDANGSIWVATAYGLTRISGKTVKSFTESETNGLPISTLKGIWQDVPNRLWIGSSEGMILFRANRFFTYGPNFGLSDRFVNVIRSDSQGTLWVGTESGLSRFEDGRFLGEAGIQDAHFGRINVLFEDREHNLWAGSQNGLARLTPKKLLVYDERQGLTRNNITAVAEDGGGSLWIGTSGGGLDQLKEQTVRSYTPASGFSNDVVSSVCAGRDGSVWAGSDSFGGLTQLKEGSITRYNLPEASVGTAINVLLVDHKGNLWIGSSRGLACLRQGLFITNDTVLKMVGDVVRAICEDKDGGLWFGTDVGLVRYKDGQCKSLTAKDGFPDDMVTALHEDDQQTLWIGTQHSGLAHFQNGALTTYTTRQGLFSDEIFEIIEDDSGWLWMSCSRGIFRVQKSDFTAFDQRKLSALTSIAYGHDDGMESVLCSAGKPGGWKTRDGQLWFPTSLGLVAMDPRAMSANRIPPPVYVEQMMVNGKPLLHLQDAFATDARLTPMRIPPGRTELEIHYTALNLRRPERIRFRYKLEGLDNNWTEADTRRVAYYNNLPPGSYSFHVMACNNDGVWNETGATLAVIHPPHFWQTPWFFAAAVLFTLVGVGGVSRYVTKTKMQRKLEMLKQQHALEKERGRLARDIHDDLGSSLTRIMLVSQRAREDAASPAKFVAHADKIMSAARDTVQALDEIVWAVNPKGDTLDGLVGYITQYASQFFGETAIRCLLEMPVDIPPLTLSAEFRHDLFLVVKEAFNNVSKHSGASEVRVRLANSDKLMTIAIEDDGRGLEVLSAAACLKGNGLENMRKRIEKLGGEFRLTSTPGMGTKLNFSVPIDSKRNGI